MARNQSETRSCPFCKEDIKAEAVKCKYCHSRLTPERPAHEGVCPYCKEDIKPEAIKCKHCQSNLLSASESQCTCGTEIGDKSLSQFMASRESRCTLACIYAGGDVTRCSNFCHCAYTSGDVWDCWSRNVVGPAVAK
jgi:hypothetical protein